MKKVVSILVFALYVASIAFVGFFGMKIVSYNPTIYPTHVECINEGYKWMSNGTKKVYDVYLGDTFQIEYRVYPDNAHDKSVSFVSGNKNNPVTTDGLVTFNKIGIFWITITTSSSDALTETIGFYVKNK